MSTQVMPNATDRQFQQAPGGGELWRVGNTHYLAYRVPEVDPPVFMTWRIEDDEQLDAVVGVDGDRTPDRTMTREKFRSIGALNFGDSQELVNYDSDPFAKLVRDYETEAAAQPWLKDPEVLATVAGAILEGRNVTQAELSQTDFWQNHSQAERDWMFLRATDPEAARDRRADYRRAVEQMLREAGMSDIPDELTDVLSGRWVSGAWSESFIRNQVRGIADPASGVELTQEVIDAARTFDPNDGDATALAGGRQSTRDRIEQMFINRGLSIASDTESADERLDRITDEVEQGRALSDVRSSLDRQAGTHPVTGSDITRQGELEVRQLVVDWLGPVLAREFEGGWMREWAGKLRNDPDAQTELLDELKTLRMANFPEWTNENLRYKDVAPTAKALFRQVWQRDPGEDDPLFTDILRMSGPGGEGLNQATQRLRREGLERGIEAVTQNVAQGINQVTGGSVRQSII